MQAEGMVRLMAHSGGEKLEMNLTRNDDGTANLTVDGPEEAVSFVFTVLISMLAGEPEQGSGDVLP